MLTKAPLWAPCFGYKPVDRLEDDDLFAVLNHSRPCQSDVYMRMEIFVPLTASCINHCKIYMAATRGPPYWSAQRGSSATQC